MNFNEDNDPGRRAFLRLVGLAGAAVALPPLLAACATDPVTGRKTLVGLTEEQEVSLDRQQSPQQFSADYGACQDERLNRYVDDVGAGLWRRSHRPNLPYSARALNANHVNAYTFPGGSIAATRGILIELQSEDELAGLLGHEIGHVNARHAAEQAGKSMLVQGGVVLASVAASGSQQYQPVVQLAGQIGSSALLAKYSRDNEREADALGMEYMARAGYNPDGMANLMALLQSEARAKPGLLETMFASHPMSDERYQTAVQRARSQYASQRSRPLQRQRYLDNTADLRRLKPVVTALQEGEGLLARNQAAQAETPFGRALGLAPGDYAANVLMAKAKLAQKKAREAEPYLAQARAVYPSEGQALQLSGVTKLALNQADAALQFFDAYERRLPGNPNTTFLRAVAYDHMQDRKQAADLYYRYARAVSGGQEAQYAVSRLREWGYVK
ncbi:peptidase M48 Ste24p [Parasulfuritortus cantonensis]|uniref:Peptidase M48 Ste24p n=1 Tax=Parasulfuritortus cantonensis TaxID=2528202 RepID=A0A4R1BL06_9PROT|nr:M48 family metalloprotease [Parasulfuritortus cantonensis]TCJ18034.1 peptidase M48 Ste24p [Parasulfuritortus cantonensis]